MKKATKRTLETFPKLEGKLSAYKNVPLKEEAVKGLNEIEATFLKLAWYFESPEQGKFNIGLLYRHLDGDWLELALELIALFFKEDTFLIQNPTLSIIHEEKAHYFNQKQFADFLSDRVKL